MSLPDEKYRSIFKMRDVLVALCYSKKCKIPAEWRHEIYYAIKHAPFASDEIIIDGKRVQSREAMDRSDLQKYVDWIDKKIKSGHTKAKRKATKVKAPKKPKTKL